LKTGGEKLLEIQHFLQFRSILPMNSAATIYQIVRYGVPFAAGFYKGDVFVQIFPCRRRFASRNDWVRAWTIFGDETITATIRHA
jgi:hypothetical protein